MNSLLALCAATTFGQEPKSDTVASLDQPVAVLPREVLGGLRTSKKDAAALQGAGVMQEKVQGRMATLKMKMERFRIKAEDTRKSEGGVPFVIHLWVHCEAAQSEKIKALRKGQAVTVTGKITLASVAVNTPNKIQINLAEAKLE